MDNRYYPGVEVDTAQMMNELRGLFDGDFQVQVMQVASASVLQARKQSTWRDLTGLSQALTIKITPETGGTRAEIGMQKWFDKAAVAAVALILTQGLLLIPAALGAYWQYKITEDAWRAIEAHITRQAGGYVPPMPGRCGNCGAANTAGADFCAQCGSNMKAAGTCRSCGAAQKDPSARFCNRCGKPLAG